MADENTEEKPVGNEEEAPATPAFPTRRRKRVFKIDKQVLADYIIKNLELDLQARDERIQRRMARYSKLMGWLPGEQWSLESGANFHLPVMMISCLKVESTLENACKSIRPMLEARALKRADKPKEKRINGILDCQFFSENEGEKKLDDYIKNYVRDEAVFSFTHYVRERQSYREIKVMSGLTPDDHIPQVLKSLQILYKDPGMNAVMTDKDGWDWEVTYAEENGQPAKAQVAFYDREDGKLEAHIAREVSVRDGSIVEVLDFEDVVYPHRSANLQPPGPANPNGAAYVNRICKTSCDAIKRRMADGTYDLLDEQDFEDIKQSKTSVGMGELQEQPKEQKDAMEGSSVGSWEGEDDNRALIEHYGRYDVDGDGLEEDIIAWVFWKSKKLAKVVYLTEMYPGLPVMRPLHSESFLPIPNRICGQCLPELLEAINEIVDMLLNQHIDWGTLVNTPFGFYRAASGIKPEVVNIHAGELYPLDDPQRDINYPTFPQRGDSYTINTMTMLQTFVERITSISDVQFGRVPTGKSSALRTLGTTLSLIAQGDARSEQMLRRLFHGLAAIYQMMHRLNRRYLPEKKEIRIIGMAEAGQDAYDEISRDDIDADIDFEFKATMLNTNKQVVSAGISEAMAMMVSPLALQAGIVTEQELYELFRDKLKALDLDPDKYMKRPPEYGPKLLAEEALTQIIAGQTPVGTPLELPQEHLSKLEAFYNSTSFGLLTPATVEIYRGWMQKVQMQIMRQQMMMQAAGQMGQMPMGMGQGGGPGGAPTTFNQPGATESPQVENNEYTDGSMVQ